jgi:hypothetical protein
VNRKDNYWVYLNVERCGSSVNIVTRLWAGRPEFNFRQEMGLFLFTIASQPAVGSTQKPIRGRRCTAGALSPGVKRLEREADHSPPSSAEVKKAWSYTSTPPIRLHGVVLTFTFTRSSSSDRSVAKSLFWVSVVSHPANMIWLFLRSRGCAPARKVSRTQAHGSWMYAAILLPRAGCVVFQGQSIGQGTLPTGRVIWEVSS